MKLATVKVEYTCGLTLTDRVTLNVSTGELHLPPRLTEVMAAVGKSECSPAFSLEYLGYVLPVEVGPDGSFDVSLPPAPPAGFWRALHSISYPTKGPTATKRPIASYIGSGVRGRGGWICSCRCPVGLGNGFQHRNARRHWSNIVVLGFFGDERRLTWVRLFLLWYSACPSLHSFRGQPATVKSAIANAIGADLVK